MCVGVGVVAAPTAAVEPLGPGSTLCLHAVEIPVAKNQGEERRLNLQRRLRDALIAASFNIPDPQAVSDLGERVQKDVGGFIDPATGRRDEARYHAFVAKRGGALRTQFGCDAVLTASVVQLRARFSGGTAEWDGATDSVSSTGRVVLNAIGGVVEFGWVGALSLWLHAVDLDGNDLAFRTAGIETLASMAVLKAQDVLPQDLWLTNVEKLDAAIRSAVGPGGEALRERGTPSGVAPPPLPSVEVQHIIERPKRDPR